MVIELGDDLSIDIVIASYNGAKYIKEQLLSIINDSKFEHIKNIFISDDHSSDETESEVANFDCDKISFFVNEGLSGPANNFINALKHTTSDYIFFCDQDDVWFNSRIGKYIELLSELNPKYPGLIYSDLLVVDSKLNVISDSFYKHENIPYDWGRSLNHLLLQNCAPGCTMLINKVAKDKLIESFNFSSLMHDWWIFLYASLYNNTIFLDQATLKYRQHENNTLGASRTFNLFELFNKMSIAKLNLKRTFEQSKAFFSTLNENEVSLLTSSEMKHLRFFSNYWNLTVIYRFMFCFNSGKLKPSLFKSLYTKFLIIRGL